MTVAMQKIVFTHKEIKKSNFPEEGKQSKEKNLHEGGWFEMKDFKLIQAPWKHGISSWEAL